MSVLEAVDHSVQSDGKNGAGYRSGLERARQRDEAEGDTPIYPYAIHDRSVWARVDPDWFYKIEEQKKRGKEYGLDHVGTLIHDLTAKVLFDNPLEWDGNPTLSDEGILSNISINPDIVRFLVPGKSGSQEEKDGVVALLSDAKSEAIAIAQDIRNLFPQTRVLFFNAAFVPKPGQENRVSNVIYDPDIARYLKIYPFLGKFKSVEALGREITLDPEFSVPLEWIRTHYDLDQFFTFLEHVFGRSEEMVPESFTNNDIYHYQNMWKIHDKPEHFLKGTPKVEKMREIAEAWAGLSDYNVFETNALSINAVNDLIGLLKLTAPELTKMPLGKILQFIVDTQAYRTLDMTGGSPIEQSKVPTDIINYLLDLRKDFGVVRWYADLDDEYAWKIILQHTVIARSKMTGEKVP